jgi:hypothetical protein
MLAKINTATSTAVNATIVAVASLYTTELLHATSVVVPLL